MTLGLLLMNLGTPDRPTPDAVRKYLAEFLSDPRVLDIHPLARAALLHGAILRTRPAQSAAAYQRVWTERGSPLLFHGLDLTGAVAARLGKEWRVELAMRYGKPTVEGALENLRRAGADRVVVFPLFPQFASSSSGSALEAVYRAAASQWNAPRLVAVEPFYDHPLFLDAFAAIGAPLLAAHKPDHVLMSFHGLPERHVRKSDESGGAHCLASATCCTRIVDANRNCYRAQCTATARGLAARLSLEPDRYTVTFQSRLGRTPWIQPYTDVVIPELASRGVRKLLVFCPAFVADCLETLEEIGIRAVEQWRSVGGDELTLVPSLNATPKWVDAVVAMARQAGNR
jgi:ferrochelatase